MTDEAFHIGRPVACMNVSSRTPLGARRAGGFRVSLVGSVFFLAPETLFSLQFAKYCYKVFAIDGTTVASQMCWDLAKNTGA